MGMFDYVRCELPLPDGLDLKHEYESRGFKEDKLFQTKDLDCLLDTYTITKDGRLKSSDEQDLNYDGWFVFYVLLPWEDDLRAYRVLFTDGQLEHLFVFDEYKYYSGA
jgi:hypothetical protein